MMGKLRLTLWFMGAFVLFYLVPGSYHPFALPRYLPLTAFEAALPLIPASFFIYLSAYLLYGSAILLVREGEPMQRFTRSAFLVLLIGGGMFYLFPTTYPRPSYPMDVAEPLWYVMQLVHAADAPTNCCPSLHVAYACLCPWFVRGRSKLLDSLLSLWAFAVVVSTLTTKQHYLIDVLAAMVLVMLVVWFEAKWWRV